MYSYNAYTHFYLLSCSLSKHSKCLSTMFINKFQLFSKKYVKLKFHSVFICVACFLLVNKLC